MRISPGKGTAGAQLERGVLGAVASLSRVEAEATLLLLGGWVTPYLFLPLPAHERVGAVTLQETADFFSRE